MFTEVTVINKCDVRTEREVACCGIFSRDIRQSYPRQVCLNCTASERVTVARPVQLSAL